MIVNEEIAAIILNYNSAIDTIQLYKQLKEYYREIRIIVIDNKSDLYDIEMLKKKIKSHELSLNSKNHGYAKGNNLGINQAIQNKAKYIWILNPDIQINKDTLPILIKTIKHNNKIAAVGPRICYRNDKKVIYSDGGIIDWSTYIAHHINNNRSINEVTNKSNIINVDYINGSTILMNVNALKNNGLFFEDFFLYYEEVEWCNRAVKKDWEIVINIEALAYHGSSFKGKTYHYYMLRNRLIFAKINDLNYKQVKNIIYNNFLKEIKRLIIRGMKPKKYFFYRIKGYVKGVLYNVKKYNESISSIQQNS